MKAGDRAGAIRNSEGTTVFVFGFGISLGDKRPSEMDACPKGFIGDIITEQDIPNPCIRLDSGELVWGAEAWIGPQERIQRLIDRFDVVKMVSINEHREKLQA